MVRMTRCWKEDGEDKERTKKELMDHRSTEVDCYVCRYSETSKDQPSINHKSQVPQSRNPGGHGTDRNRYRGDGNLPGVKDRGTDMTKKP